MRVDLIQSKDLIVSASGVTLVFVVDVVTMAEGRWRVKEEELLG